jgi:hypothetical protein
MRPKGAAMKTPKRLFRDRFKRSYYDPSELDQRLVYVRLGLRWLEEHGCILIIPPGVTRTGGRRIFLIRSPDGSPMPCPAVDVHDPEWIARTEQDRGIPDRWLFRHIQQSVARGWLPPPGGTP